MNLHISTRTDTMLCGVPDVSGTLRRYLTAPIKQLYAEYQACERCEELEPLALLAATDLGDGAVELCRAGCGRPGTHHASYDCMWTCEECIT